MRKLVKSIKGEVETLRKLLRRRVYASSATTASIVDQFHRLYYDSHLFGGTWRNTSWLGVPVWKCPFDLWVYQEILWEIRPSLIIETGTAHGGSAFYFASLFDLIAHGRIITIDISTQVDRPRHPRIEYVAGSSVDPAIVERVRRSIRPEDAVMVVLDSDHRKEHVLEELRSYHPLVTPGSYLVVEDTNLNGHPVASEGGPGPMEAVEEFLKGTSLFVVDRAPEKFYLTFNPSGFLRRVA